MELPFPSTTSLAKNRRANDLNPAKQALALRREFPNARVKVRANGLTWVGCLQPSALSLVYTVRIEYDLGRRPRVTVIDPPRETLPGSGLRHVFPGDVLCLHYQHQWTGDMLIARSVVAWASEWLLHHELWLATGEWLGGGHEPASATSGRSSSMSE